MAQERLALSKEVWTGLDSLEKQAHWLQDNRSNVSREEQREQLKSTRVEEKGIE